MTTIIDSAVEKSAASPEALLKAAVSGAKPAESKAAAPVPTAARAVRRFDAVTMGLAGAALAVGTVLGAGTAMLATSTVPSARAAPARPIAIPSRRRPALAAGGAGA
ncbi:MAG: hypothetical protein EOO66_24670, partial [Methylobacterium sp.]